MLRLPVEIRQQLEEACLVSRRTLTAEILARLVASFGQEAQPRLQLVTAKYTGDLELTPSEAETLAKLRQATPRQRKAVLQLLGAMIEPG